MIVSCFVIEFDGNKLLTYLLTPKYATELYVHVYMCSGSLVVTAYDSESGHPGSNPELGLIYYKASIIAQGLPEPSSLRGSTLGTRAAEHKDCNWGMQVD